MNKFLRTYLPAFSMAFTFIILYATISNIIAVSYTHLTLPTILRV